MSPASKRKKRPRKVPKKRKKKSSGQRDKEELGRRLAALRSNGLKEVRYEDLIDMAGVEPDDFEAAAEAVEEAEAAGMSVLSAPEPTRKRAGEADAFQIYLREIGRIPLLSAEEERALARRIDRDKNRMKRIERDLRRRLKHFTPEAVRAAAGGRRKSKKRDLARAYLEAERDYREGQRRFLEANLRLVVSIAKYYTGRGLPLPDLVNEGNLGLMKALERFDYKKGFKFSTYATWWIRQSIRRALADQGRMIRVPVHMCDLINAWIQTTRHLSQRLGREPTFKETAAAMGISETKAIEVFRAAQEPASLDAPTQEAESDLGDLIPDDASPSPYQSVLGVAFSEHIEKMLACLSEREEQILRLRYGLDGGERLTLDETGAVVGITRERVRQIEMRALSRLRHLRLSQELFRWIHEGGPETG